MKIHWGILSTARITDALIGPIKQTKRSEFAAVASRSLDKASAFAQENGIPQAYGSYEELLADPTIDLVYIPLPHNLHCDWTVKAAEAGKHVLCEKPIVTTLEDMDRIEAAASANDVAIFEAFMYLNHPQMLKVKEMIAEGKLGTLRFVTSWMGFYLPPENNWDFRLNPAMGGGSMWDTGVYPNSLTISLAGLPEEVWARQILGEAGVDVAFDAQMRFSGGMVAQLSTGFRSPIRDEAHIVGDKGAVHLNDPWRWRRGTPTQDSEIVFSSISSEEKDVTVVTADPFLCEVEAMEACVLDGATPNVPLSLSRVFLRCALAMYKSARTGRVVKL
ncbi:MAG: Gfo/Idh/MocA family oxidoreductase [Anaerolineales bacterium]|nr:Gfo/Idh/MocA family oxidoreductase [Anaerolineales bacterium]